MIKKSLLSILILASFVRHVSAQGVGQGTRIDLTSKLGLNSGTTGQFAQLFIPDYYQAPINGKFDLVFHLHSASWAAEDEVYKANANVILFNIHLGGFSSSYQNYFAYQTYFQNILDSVTAIVNRNGIISNPQIEHLIITSFSAGYGGVREILKNSSYYNKINVLTLADGLHCNSDSATRIIQMQDFLRFAKDARDKLKVMYLTHSSILTSGYDNTTQTANYLINGIGSLRAVYSAIDEIGTQYSRCDTGNFHLKGYYGDTANDHLKHLYAMNIMLRSALDILYNQSTGFKDGEPDDYNFNLKQNYPNPFNPSTKISWQSPVSSRQILKVFNVLGSEIATLVDEYKPAGKYEIDFKSSVGSRQLPSGVYFYRLQVYPAQSGSDELSVTRKMILTK
jgi:hypothetical protein